ncbi:MULTISPECIES: type II toxin-antitoxin system RelE/ParE family toxin [Providencia]|uniref:type II toxin-antitoxin system RelE/ParE family toxin n=1 Tax=Providencia TaxID=586 RepID=UPI000807C130|nr:MULTISPECIES: type II toxin-antitoxin system RelE/ParE family toxin [Providencia]ELR5286165.1 type II toxin-antitoxin system RelE/ParE family toxin [Providencia rettgeri]MBG5899753.1 type II toxin-antitoxin system RelE/ParE family toxin [Providencia rettgeri]MBG5921738.1 type II toxin-antitoxin system RelE/ParE family toxin [Providencia rettgeri]MBQ0343148.1 type II toxin-antitoxin system RelE/ParE family toxin [Providencia rettgeri]MCG5380016.1 type II toxin-antitoxin system RelE/ParE fami
MYKLSNLAAKDFEGIFEYTLINFGVRKADEYTKSLHCVLEMLSSNPLIGLECAEISVEIRRYNHSKHVIFYRHRTNDIFVIRVLHQQMEPLKHFYFDEFAK